MYIACQKGYLEVVQFLKESGCNLETPTKKGETPGTFSLSLFRIQLSDGRSFVFECLLHVKMVIWR